MAKHFRCGHLFTGLDDAATTDQTVIVGDDGRIGFVGATDAAPTPAGADTIVDHSGLFVMPGLIEGHVHFVAGNAPTEEDVDIHASLEFKALRTVINAQRLLAAGYTAVIDGGGSGRGTLSVRDAINAGMFVGPRICCAGSFITTRQGYPDMYPSWFNNPTSMRALVSTLEDGIEAIRVQVKDGVDFIKLDLDGKARDREGRHVACFTEHDTHRLIDEAHRLGKRVKVHAKGARAMTYAAGASVEAIAHAAWMDDAALAAIKRAGTMVNPQLTIIHNFVTFTQPSDGYFRLTHVGENEWAATVESMKRAHATGVPIMCGTDSGFAINPFGEWHALEFKLLVDHVGLTPAEALRSATSVNASFFDDQIGAIEPGRHTDILVIDGNPLTDVGILLDKSKIAALYLGGEPVDVQVPPIDAPREVAFSSAMWRDIYDQKAVADLARLGQRREIGAAPAPAG